MNMLRVKKRNVVQVAFLVYILYGLWHIGHILGLFGNRVTVTNLKQSSNNKEFEGLDISLLDLSPLNQNQTSTTEVISNPIELNEEKKSNLKRFSRYYNVCGIKPTWYTPRNWRKEILQDGLLHLLKKESYPEDMTFMYGREWLQDPDLVYPYHKGNPWTATASSDRLLQQLAFDPTLINRTDNVSEVTIFLTNEFNSFEMGLDYGLCAAKKCRRVNRMDEAKVVLTKSAMSGRQPNQLWGIFILESPAHTDAKPLHTNLFNWTLTYRRDSTIVTPYAKYVPYDRKKLLAPPRRNYALGKTIPVVWFTSNCFPNNNRLEYVQELAKYITVDIYGTCGTLTCNRFTEDERCRSLLKTTYKFYLAFENSNCRDYITEKFYHTPLEYGNSDIVPVVMGAPPEDYERVAPTHSYIHVDDFESPKELADYLHTLDQDDYLYNQYFAWKGLWHKIETYYLCRVCNLAHDASRLGPTWEQDFTAWYGGHHCLEGKESWRDVPRPLPSLTQRQNVLDYNFLVDD